MQYFIQPVIRWLQRPEYIPGAAVELRCIVLYLTQYAGSLGVQYYLIFQHIGQHIDACQLVAYLIMEVLCSSCSNLALLFCAQFCKQFLPALLAAGVQVLQQYAQQYTRRQHRITEPGRLLNRSNDLEPVRKLRGAGPLIAAALHLEHILARRQCGISDRIRSRPVRPWHIKPIHSVAVQHLLGAA